MTGELRQRVLTFVKPLYQDLDGVSYFGDVERVSAIARQLRESGGDEDFELLLAFQGLREWLGKVGNISRAVLIIGSGLTEERLARVAASLRRLENPGSDAERALAAALLIDAVGLVGLVDRFVQARREGAAVRDVAAETVSARYEIPDWLPSRARDWVARRIAARRDFCEQYLKELEREDLK